MTHFCFFTLIFKETKLLAATWVNIYVCIVSLYNITSHWTSYCVHPILSNAVYGPETQLKIQLGRRERAGVSGVIREIVP